MAESFFIRQTLNIGNTNTFTERAVDLGSYVDALNQSILKVHRVDVAFTDSTGRSLSMAAADTAAVAQFQLTTQTQSDIVLPSDRSMVAAGKIEAYTPSIATSTICETLSFLSFACVKIACDSSLTVMLYWFPMPPPKRIPLIKIML